MRLTSPLWYLAAFLLALGSAMVATAVAASGFDSVRDATVTPVNQRVDAAGKTLAVYTNDESYDDDVACHARGRDKVRVEIPGKALDITAQGDGETWHLIALLENGRDDLKVVCTPRDKRVDTAAYGAAAVTGYASTVNNGRGIAILGVTVGAVLAAYVFWCRRLVRKEAKYAANPHADGSLPLP